MGLLSKLIKKTGKAVVDSKPVEKPFQQKKITNPLVRKKVPNLQTSDYQKELDSMAGKYTVPKVLERSTPPSVLGQLYSPVRSTIEQIQFGKEGVKGENLAKRVKEFAPNVSGSEKNFANVQLEPKKRYTQTELLDLVEGKADNIFKEEDGFEATPEKENSNAQSQEVQESSDF